MLGSGTETDPYQITTVSELQDMQNDLSAYYILMNDIDASATEFNPIGYDQDNRFVGGFEGNGYVISDLYINKSTDKVGLFGWVTFDAEIRHVGLENVDITGTRYVGALIGFQDNGLGLVSHNYSTGTVSGGDEVGGLVGYNSGTTIDNCYSTATVSGNDSVGGLVGTSKGYENYCYSIGSVTGSSNVGGLIGANESGYNVSSYYNIETSGQSTSGGGSGRTTAEMTTYPYDLSNVYTNWNFTDIWGYNDRNSLYPVLQVFQENNCQVYNGSSWEDKPFIVYLGSPTNDWIRMYPYGYNGTSWI